MPIKFSKPKTIHRRGGSSAFGKNAPWQDSPMDMGFAVERDEDGFPLNTPAGVKKQSAIYKWLQTKCWQMWCDNPQVRTAVMDKVGRLCGRGFDVMSGESEIMETLRMIQTDPRNRLTQFWPKLCGRAEIEGELYLVCTIHKDGFVEVDFRDPGTLGGSFSDSGIFSLDNKPTMPLVYQFTDPKGRRIQQIPSLFLLRYPELLAQLKKQEKGLSLSEEMLNEQRSSHPKFKQFGGFFRFVIAWDKGMMTERNVSHLRTIIKWINLYENLKLYEIDHKKSSGSYVWSVNFEDARAYRLWQSLTKEQKSETGLMASKAPGSTILLPPGMTVTASGPTLPKISDADTDIMSMVTSGLNTTQDMALGTQNSTYASAKASRGPMTDRIQDETTWWECFLRNDFWASIFWVRAKMGAMKEFYKVRRCVGFKKQEPVFKNVSVRAEDLIEFSFPTSAMADMESLAKALLGVKHGALPDTLGIPRSKIATQMGFGSYEALRQRHAEEEEQFPELSFGVDDTMTEEAASGDPNNSESVQETSADDSQQK